MALVLVALGGSQAAAEAPLVAAAQLEPPAATRGTEPSPPVVPVLAPTRPIAAVPSLDERQQRVLLMLMMSGGAPRAGYGILHR